MTSKPAYNRGGLGWIGQLIFIAGFTAGLFESLMNRPRGRVRCRSFSFLRGRVLGRSKQVISRSLGPPRTAALAGQFPRPSGRQPAFFAADLWYYALDSRGHSTMVVEFADGVAKDVEFLVPKKSR